MLSTPWSLMRCIILFFVVGTFSTALGVGAKKAETGRKKLETSTVWTDYGDSKFYRYRLNTALGMNIIKGSALVSGMQFGYAPKVSLPLYVGPEFNFSLFSPGHVFSLLATAWYQFRIAGTSRLGIVTGVSIGPGFASSVSYLPTTPLVALLDLAVVQDIDDLVSIRGEFRPGIIAQHFCFMMNFNVAYRFP